MKPVTLDMAKLLGFRIAQSADTKIGIKLGFDKAGLVKSDARAETIARGD